MCAAGPPGDSAVLASKEVEPAPWWDPEFEMSRRRYDAQYLAVWHALFVLLVLIWRALGPVYRLLLRERETAIRQDPGFEIGPGASRVAAETALTAFLLPAPAEEMGSLLRAFVRLRAQTRPFVERPKKWVVCCDGRATESPVYG